MRSRDLLKLGIIWKVGNGQQISFWNDNWVENRNLVDILDLNNESISQSRVKVSEFIINQSQWNILLLNQVLNNHPIVHKIKGIPIPMNATEDSFC